MNAKRRSNAPRRPPASSGDWSEDEQSAGKVGRLHFIKPNVVRAGRPGYDKPGGLSPRNRSIAIDGSGKARTIKPKKLTPPGSGDLDDWAERRQVENPSYGRRTFVARSWRRLSACGASDAARPAGLGVVVRPGERVRQTGSSSPRGGWNSLRKLVIVRGVLLSSTVQHITPL